METALIAVTISSLAVALVMSVVTWRMAQEQRRRSDARVAALASELAEGGAELPLRRAHDAVPPHRVVSAAEWPARNTEGYRAPRPAAPVPETSAPPPAVGELFATTAQERPANRRLAPTVAVVALAAVGLMATFVVLGGGEERPAAAVPAERQALELLSLRHDQQNGALKVTGLVRNPDSGTPLDRVTAVVFFFDSKGAFLASSRAPLDFARLGPGDESPFTITVSAPAGVSRYRVSFRKDEGAVIPHVDRRERN